jgi:O-antigen/teichoic acid export membrane protein
VSGTRRFGSGVAQIGVAIAIASAAGFVVQPLVARSVGPAEFGLFIAFWGVLFGIGSSLSTLEQEVARRTASGAEPEHPSTSSVIGASAALAVLVAALTTIPPVADRLYGAAGPLAGVVVVVAAAGFSVQFAVRGSLIGSSATRHYAGLVVAEAMVRLVLLLAVVVTIGLDRTGAMWVVAAGSFAWLLWCRRARALWTAPRAGEWPVAIRRAGSLMTGAGLNAVVITAYPSLVTALSGGSPGHAGGGVFAALTLSRLPLLLVSPVQAMAVPIVVSWRDGAGSGGAQLRRALVLLVGGATAVGLLGAVAGWFLGPWAVRLLNGPDYVVSPAVMATLIFSACLLAGVLLMSAALVALGAHLRMVLMWFVAVAVTVAWLLLNPFGIATATAVGALVGPVAAMGYGLPAIWTVVRAPRVAA